MLDSIWSSKSLCWLLAALHFYCCSVSLSKMNYSILESHSYGAHLVSQITPVSMAGLFNSLGPRVLVVCIHALTLNSCCVTLYHIRRLNYFAYPSIASLVIVLFSSNIDFLLSFWVIASVSSDITRNLNDSTTKGACPFSIGYRS